MGTVDILIKGNLLPTGTLYNIELVFIDSDSGNEQEKNSRRI